MFGQPSAYSEFVHDLDEECFIEILGRESEALYGKAGHLDGSALSHGPYPLIAPSNEIARSEPATATGEENQSVYEMASGTAHNFQNSLQIILGCCELALQDLDMDNVAEVRKHLERIIDAALIGKNTAKQLQQVGRQRRMTHEKDKPECGETFDLTEIASQVIDMITPLLVQEVGTSGITITVVNDLAPVCQVQGNRNEMFDVIINIIKNSVEALPKAGQISVRTVPGSDVSFLIIEDNGVGIDEGDLGQVFKPYWTTKGINGSGMGLASSLAIVKRHGGEIRVDSHYGKGTSFTIALPSAR